MKPLNREYLVSAKKPFKLVSPEGQLIEGVNLRQFALKNSLNRGHLQLGYGG
jgi:hypothetical protein